MLTNYCKIGYNKYSFLYRSEASFYLSKSKKRLSFTALLATSSLNIKFPMLLTVKLSENKF